MSVSDNLAAVRATLPDGVTLVAVSKFHPAKLVREAYDAGQRIFGENRPQEMALKQTQLPPDIAWQMLGHLQTNKVRLIAPFVALIQSVDSARLAEEIQKEAARNDRVIDILLEIHVAQEESKSGWDFAELATWLADEPFAVMPNVCVRGVMGMATNTDDETVVRRDFAELQRCFEKLQPRFGARFDTLSMGMSGDYRLAMACGSTMVRIGSAIFGERHY